MLQWDPSCVLLCILSNTWELLAWLLLERVAGCEVLSVDRTSKPVPRVCAGGASLIHVCFWSNSCCMQRPKVAGATQGFYLLYFWIGLMGRTFAQSTSYFLLSIICQLLKRGLITTTALRVDLSSSSSLSNSFYFPCFCACYKSVNLSLLSNKQTSALDPFPLGQFARNNKFNFSSQLKKFHFTE